MGHCLKKPHTPTFIPGYLNTGRSTIKAQSSRLWNLQCRILKPHAKPIWRNIRPQALAVLLWHSVRFDPHPPRTLRRSPNHKAPPHFSAAQHRLVTSRQRRLYDQRARRQIRRGEWESRHVMGRCQCGSEEGMLRISVRWEDGDGE